MLDSLEGLPTTKYLDGRLGILQRINESVAVSVGFHSSLRNISLPLPDGTG